MFFARTIPLVLLVVATAARAGVTTVRLHPLGLSLDRNDIRFEGVGCFAFHEERLLVTNTGMGEQEIGFVSNASPLSCWLAEAPSTVIRPRASLNVLAKFMTSSPSPPMKEVCDLTAAYPPAVIAAERERIERAFDEATTAVVKELKELEQRDAERVFDDLCALARTRYEEADRPARAEQDKAIQDKEVDMPARHKRELDEYLRGEFCNGCGKTRSFIEAKGERFPHQNQTVRAATPGELAALKMQHQHEHAKLDVEITVLRDKRKRLAEDYNRKIAALEERLAAAVRKRTAAYEEKKRQRAEVDTDRSQVLADLDKRATDTVRVQLRLFAAPCVPAEKQP